MNLNKDFKKRSPQKLFQKTHLFVHRPENVIYTAYSDHNERNATMDKKAIERVLKDINYWSDKLEETTARVEPLLAHVHRKHSFENDFIVKNELEHYAGYSRLLSDSLMELDALRAKKPSFIKRLFKR